MYNLSRIVNTHIFLFQQIASLEAKYKAKFPPTRLTVTFPCAPQIEFPSDMSWLEVNLILFYRKYNPKKLQHVRISYIHNYIMPSHREHKELFISGEAAIEETQGARSRDGTDARTKVQRMVSSNLGYYIPKTIVGSGSSVFDRL